MHVVALERETDFEGWRHAARALAVNEVPPGDVDWTVKSGERGLFGSTALPDAPANARFHVAPAFLDLARQASLNRDPQRFARMYRLLWRLRGEPRLLQSAVDADVASVQSLAKEVRRDLHKMKAFVRFREFEADGQIRFVSWFEPSHYIVEANTPFFTRRFADMPWSILTPDACVHWNGREAAFTAGALKTDAPSGDPLEATWRTYYASIFNPARLKVKAMQAEMPKKYWRNLPEASLIDPLIAKAGDVTRAMIAAKPQAPRPSQQRLVRPVDGKTDTPMTLDLLMEDTAGLAREAANCRACPLWKDATQTVFGEGPSDARIMFVGEQPGDKEDLAGKPFVGPAGQVFDRALAEAKVDRSMVYVTNAVKHFKFIPRGKKRIHQKPNTSEINACRQWYQREVVTIRPALIVALGATAAQCVFGKATPIGKTRGRLIDLDDNTKVLVTVHPSYLLRLPDEDAKQREYAQFVSDLKLAAGF